MLNPKKLRSENYIYSSLTDSVVQVNIKLLRLIESEIRVKGETTYKGIPITEELLLKSGFVKSKYLNHILFSKLNSVGENHSEIIVDMSDGLKVFLDINGFAIEIDCKYIHKLQNLYYDITTEELQIKL